MRILAFDTSNYTTSVSLLRGEALTSETMLLNVRPGELGLRQSDALFAHVQNLPLLMEKLGTCENSPEAIGASNRPRCVEGSYMPCFLAGTNMARSISALLGVPLYLFSHQQGHLAAVLNSAKRMDLLNRPFLAWHLSGGTTELLLVNSEPGLLHCRIIGGTSDISAGQVIDRTGKLLGLPFPSGKMLQKCAEESACKERFKVKLNGCSFSLSGLENQVQRFYQERTNVQDTAAFALNSVCDIISRCSEQAQKDYPGLEIVFTGGVSSNLQLREKMASRGAVFGEPRFSTDNAGGIAVLTNYAHLHASLAGE